MPDGWISVGQVRSVNPMRREVRVAPFNGMRRWFDELEWLGAVRPGTAAPLRCKVAQMRWHGDLAIVEFSPGVAKETVAELKGADVSAPESQRPLDIGHEYHAEELLHYKVHDAEGVYIGEVVDAFDTAAHGILEIAPVSGGRLLVPAINEVIQEILREEGVVVVRDLIPYAVRDAD